MLLFPWSAGGKQLAGAATVLSWLTLGLCSRLWLCTTICFNGRVWDLAELSSDQSPAGVTVPACLCQQPGLAERSTGSPGQPPPAQEAQPGRKFVGLSRAVEQLPQNLPKARPQELPRPSGVINFVPPQSSLSAVNAGCSTPWLWARYYNLRISNHRKQSCLWRQENGSYCMNYKSSSIPNWHLSVKNKTQAPQISSRLLCALQCELKRKGLESSIVL